MKIKKKNVIKESILVESHILDILNKLNPTEIKILKAMGKRFGTTYMNEQDMVDELIKNWGLDFSVAIRLSKIYKHYKYVLTYVAEDYKETLKSSIFVEYLGRYIYVLEEELDQDGIIPENLNFKYHTEESSECSTEAESRIWTYSRGLDNNNYFTFYTQPTDYKYDECRIRPYNSILTMVTFTENDDNTINVNFRMKNEVKEVDSGGSEEVFNLHDVIIPIPEKIDEESTKDWFFNTLYKKYYQEALESFTFQFVRSSSQPD